MNSLPFSLRSAIYAVSLSLLCTASLLAGESSATSKSESQEGATTTIAVSAGAGHSLTANNVGGSYMGTLINAATDRTFRLVAPHLYASTAVFPVNSGLTSGKTVAGSTTTTNTGLQIPPVVGPPVTGTPAFTGTVSKVKIRTGDSNKEVLAVKAKVSLTNVADMTLRGITATVYLSDDDSLDAADTKLVTLDLGDYFAKNKLGKGQTRKLQLKREVPAALASFLEGKYLIVDLKAENASDTGEDYAVVVGPIDLP